MRLRHPVRWILCSRIPFSAAALCCSVLQCVAAALQCVAVRCSVLQCVAACYGSVRSPLCKVLQCVVVCCSALHCFVVCCSMLQQRKITTLQSSFRSWRLYYSVLQCVTVCCSSVKLTLSKRIPFSAPVLQCVAVCCMCCSVLQGVAAV